MKLHDRLHPWTLKQIFLRFLAQLTTIISKIISPDTQERKRFYILGARKVKKNILLKVDWCSLVPNNLLKSSLVPWKYFENIPCSQNLNAPVPLFPQTLEGAQFLLHLLGNFGDCCNLHMSSLNRATVWLPAITEKARLVYIACITDYWYFFKSFFRIRFSVSNVAGSCHCKWLYLLFGVCLISNIGLF